MGRGLDHAIHVVRDLDVAGSFYQRLGFQVGARNKHPWGTANRIVQLPGFFVEILGVAEPDKIPPMGAGTFSFGAFNRDFLVRKGEGPAGLVLESKDAAADKIAFDQAGFGGFAPLEFSRKAVRADGSETEVGFSIAFARDPASPDVAFFTCRQKAPENFWSAELQRHANGAQAIAAAVFVAENPTDHHIFLETFSGSRDVRATSLGLRVATPRGVILALDGRGFEDSLGLPPLPDVGLRLAALVFRVAHLAATKALFDKNGVAHREHRERLVVGPEIAHGAALVFER
ncbi:MAG TPA: VOC family protein [Xanthobacteraceae bacterium]|nr:VOC family protein [Xanthobacteraceae bacterium]